MKAGTKTDSNDFQWESGAEERVLRKGGGVTMKEWVEFSCSDRCGCWWKPYWCQDCFLSPALHLFDSPAGQTATVKSRQAVKLKQRPTVADKNCPQCLNCVGNSIPLSCTLLSKYRSPKVWPNQMLNESKANQSCYGCHNLRLRWINALSNPDEQDDSQT